MRRLPSFAGSVLIAALAVLFCALPQAGAAQEAGPPVALAPVPDWADDLPEAAALDSAKIAGAGGIRHLLKDRQFAWVDGRRQVWSRDVTQILSPEGIAEGELNVLEYNAALEDFALTRVSLWRDGVETDLTGSVQPVAAPWEWDAPGQVLNRRLMVVVPVEGLRVGDVVDISALRSTRPDAPAPDREVYAELEFHDPVILARAVVNWPADWPVNIRPLPATVARIEGPLPGGGTRLEFQRIEAVPGLYEEGVPVWIDQQAVLRMTPDRDWSALAADYAPYYQADHPLGAWEDALRDLVAADAGAEARALAALHLVQDGIDYLPVAFHDGSTRARLPAEVIASGYGDAADKALLLAVMLRRMGIAADVALTHRYAGHGLDQASPSVGAFDHAIVRVRIGGQDWWLDPALTGQRGRLAALTPPDYGFALVLAEGQSAPQPIPAAPERVWTSIVTEKYRFTLAGLYLDVYSEHRGQSADDLRLRHDESGEDISLELFGYYGDLLPGLRQLKPITLNDEPEANRLTLHESYFLPAEAIRLSGLRERFPFAAEDFSSDLPQSPPQGRKFPWASGPPGLYRHRIEVRGAGIDFTPPAPVLLENELFRYRLEASAPGHGRLELDWEFLTRRAVIPARDVAKIAADARRIWDTTWFSWDLR
ncbi:DUF3857 domain-containing protein [Pseudogemmobacter humi]|uniref:DUF3857 domain-containing protein n=1 Tax=Pseudogemmobacter humi TaxID=2483812 RepID=A0A3P5XRL2_9RHOB|nr:DUF3857 domain-containing protein [Pseudogemmobacter humi]VDC33003.1 hypothetical protein XINFAN_03549 [Pseudogemmobacter humi]